MICREPTLRFLSHAVVPAVACGVRHRLEGGVSAINANASKFRFRGSIAGDEPVASRPRAVLVVLVLAFLLSVFATPAFAGQASSGKLPFYPCDRCHPVFLGPDGNPTKPLPNGLKKHEIKLELHNILGADDKACLACHDDPKRNPGMLILPDGTLVDINGPDVSRVCQRCHFEKYSAWKAGTHGKHQPKCTAAGCHDPHTPGFIYVPALLPFLGTGTQVQVLPERVAFTSFPPPAAYPAPPTVTPSWLVVVGLVGVVIAGGIAVPLIRGRSKQ